MGIIILHAVWHHRAVQRGLVAQINILVLGGDFDQSPAHQPQFSLGQLGQFVDDFLRAHGGKLIRPGTLVGSKYHLFARPSTFTLL